MSKRGFVLDERFLNTCIFCGNSMKAKSPYDFYCSKVCEKKDNKRIQRAINEGKHPTEILFENIKEAGGHD